LYTNRRANKISFPSPVPTLSSLPNTIIALSVELILDVVIEHLEHGRILLMF